MRAETARVSVAGTGSSMPGAAVHAVRVPLYGTTTDLHAEREASGCIRAEQYQARCTLMAGAPLAPAVVTIAPRSAPAQSHF
ncbi:hypothetical protein NDU88_007115 [Pleurodeles waltl]|uniref:Uncharacterized protein n=1 Tax=Pleurodeles waltl TaxID=8319 RepID=A0AAV7U0H6_PLEWA|nr:hypothetical protein NDU88_007115 [Pleurodeles waltl]